MHQFRSTLPQMAEIVINDLFLYPRASDYNLLMDVCKHDLTQFT